MTEPPVAYVLTPRELNTHSKQYDGREVVVRGFVILGTNGRSLYQSKERLEEFERNFRAQTPGFNPGEFDADCLTLLNAQVLEENQSVFNGRTITVRGRFESNYQTGDVLDLQACGGPTALALNERDTRRLLHALQHAHQDFIGIEGHKAVERCRIDNPLQSPLRIKGGVDPTIGLSP